MTPVLLINGILGDFKLFCTKSRNLSSISQTRGKTAASGTRYVDRNLQGLSRTRMFWWVEAVEFCKDLGRIASTWERICKDLGRITSTWKGSAMTLEGSFWPPPPPPPGSALSEVILPKLTSWVSIEPPPPRISIGRGNPSKVIVDPFQVQAILPRSLWILSKWRQSFQSHCRSFPSWGDPSKVFADPFQVEVILPKSLQILSKLSVDWPPPGSALSEVILLKSSQILSKLSVDQPPPLPSPPT